VGQLRWDSVVGSGWPRRRIELWPSTTGWVCRSSQSVVGGLYVELERTPEAVAVSVGTQGVGGLVLVAFPLAPS